MRRFSKVLAWIVAVVVAVPVLLAARKDQVSPYGRARQIMNLHTMEDSHTLISPPTTTWKFTFRVWMSEPSR